MSKCLAMAALCLSALAAAADEGKPEPSEPARKGDRWEYAELVYSSARANWGAAGGAPGGNRGKGGPGGDAVPAKAKAKATARWVSGDGETEGEGWDGLAAKLKAPAAAKDASPAAHKVKLLNHLGGLGWELVSSDGATMTFKRLKKADRAAKSDETKEATKIFRLKHAKADSVAKTVEKLQGQKGRVACDERTNSLIVVASDEHLKKLAGLIEELDVPPAEVKEKGRK